LNTLVQTLRQFSIRLRLLAMAAVVLGLLASMAGLAGLSGLRVQSLLQDFTVQAVDQMAELSAAREHLAQVRLLEKQMVIDYEDGVAVLKSRDRWTKELAATDQALAGLVDELPPAGQTAAKEARARLVAYAKGAQTVLDNIQNGNYDNARVADGRLGNAKADVIVAEASLADVSRSMEEAAATLRSAFDAALLKLALVFGGASLLAMAVIVPMTLLNLRSITQPMDQAVALAQAIACGDLSGTVLLQGRDETAQMLGALAQMQHKLRETMTQVQQASQSIQSASSEVAAGNSDLSQRTEQAGSSLQQTASAMEQFTGTVQQTAHSASSAKQLAANASQVAARGGAAVAQVVSTMEQINTSSKRIADIVGTIDGIAFQTNILALNAAVEAARAGEQGRGFAVVASEVRSLSQRSAQAAREIKGLIAASMDKVESGSRQVQDAGSTMTEIVASVQRVSDLIAEISAAAAQQSSGIGEVNQAVSGLDRMTRQNAALVEQSAAAADSLKDQAMRLSHLVGGFKLEAANNPG